MLFNRYELKFVIDWRGYQRLLGLITPFCAEDPNDPGHRGYPVTSLYFDSPDLTLAFEKHESLNFRRKVRLRFYSSTPTESVPYLEIKEKHGNVIFKKRAKLEPMTRLGDAGDIQTWCRGMDPVVKEVAFLAARYRLRPATWIRYTRRVWLGRFHNQRVRITTDIDLHSARGNGDPVRALRFLPADRLILEVKVEGRLPRWLQEALLTCQFKQVKFSKYTNGLRACLPWPRRGLGLPAVRSESVMPMQSAPVALPGGEP